MDWLLSISAWLVPKRAILRWMLNQLLAKFRKSRSDKQWADAVADTKAVHTALGVLIDKLSDGVVTPQEQIECEVAAETADSGMAPALLVGRMSVPQPVEARFNQIYNQERLPLYRSIPGYIRARRFTAVLGEPKYLTVHECESPDVAESPEWEKVRVTETPYWTDNINPRMTHAAGAPGVYRRVFPD